MVETDPIKTSTELESALKSLSNLTTEANSNINALNTLNNIDSQILLKKDQLIKIKNEELNQQIKYLQNFESNIINKDRLIEETNLYIEKNDKNITVLIFSILFSIILLIIILMYVYNNINPYLFNLLLIVIVLMYVVLFLYAYDIFYFKTVVNFFDYRKKENIVNAVKDWSKFTKTDLQQKLYGSKKEWDDSNCNCPPQDNIYSNEANIGVKQIPGLYYYDKNSPNQLIVGNENNGTIINKGEKVDVSDNTNKKIFNKIDWVNHDNYETTNQNQTGVYELNQNIGSYYNNGFNDNSTFTANL